MKKQIITTLFLSLSLYTSGALAVTYNSHFNVNKLFQPATADAGMTFTFDNNFNSSDQLIAVLADDNDCEGSDASGTAPEAVSLTANTYTINLTELKNFWTALGAGYEGEPAAPWGGSGPATSSNHCLELVFLSEGQPGVCIYNVTNLEASGGNFTGFSSANSRNIVVRTGGSAGEIESCS